MLTLLLNSTYECISFIPERKLFKLLAKEKIEVLEQWDEKVVFGRGVKIQHPAVVRLKHHVRWIPRKVKFKRSAIFKRDQDTCQYCSRVFPRSKLTLDHVIPKTRGGNDDWRNCVAACFVCNNKKSNKTPEEAKMPLLRRPVVPDLNIRNEFNLLKNKHDSWASYIPE